MEKPADDSGEVVDEGEGQEPLNSVYYKDWDDQYRPHCDGECYGGPGAHGAHLRLPLPQSPCIRLHAHALGLIQ